MSRFSCWVNTLVFILFFLAQGTGKSTNQEKKKQRLGQGKQNFRAAFPKGKLELEFFLWALDTHILDIGAYKWLFMNSILLNQRHYYVLESTQ